MKRNVYEGFMVVKKLDVELRNETGTVIKRWDAKKSRNFRFWVWVFCEVRKNHKERWLHCLCNGCHKQHSNYWRNRKRL